MIRTVLLKIANIKKDQKGTVLVLVGLCLMPIMLMLGLAIDSSVGMQQKRKLQMAVDAAAQAGATNADSASITADAQKVFTVNTSGMKGVTGPAVSVNTTSKTVTVSASVVVQNTFMGMGGIPTSAYNATATAPIGASNLAEIAIVYEVSDRFYCNSFHQNICNALINFVNTLPDNVMVSIIPIATEFSLDSSTTATSNLFGHLSMTTNDEAANPAFYPLGPNYAWTSANYNTVQNPYYFPNGSYADFPTDPGVLISNQAPATCPGGYASCSPRMWPLKCPTQYKNTSCSQFYSYMSNVSYPILPLTLNKTLIVGYLNGLKAFRAQADGLFPSFISWGWRTIDPAWKDFWMVNSNKDSLLRSTGQYPNAYGGQKKSMILIFNNTAYWDDFATNVNGYYINPCGDATKVVNGLNHWWMSGYGMVPVPTDYQSYTNDITCENKWFKTMDKSLGLTLSDATNYNATVTTSTFKTRIINEVTAKFFRICTNIKAQDIDIYLLANGNTGTLAPCCNTSANAYTIGNSGTSISTALNAVLTKIKANLK